MEDEITLEETVEESVEGLSFAFEDVDALMESLGKGEIFKKAKAIKKEHPNWDWAKCVKEASGEVKPETKPEEQKKEEKPETPIEPPKEKTPEDYYKEKKSELESLIKTINEELKKKEAYPKPCAEKKKDDTEKMALKNELQELKDKFELFKNKGFKVTKQSEELKENKGITYLTSKDGSIMQDWAGYCGWK